MKGENNYAFTQLIRNQQKPEGDIDPVIVIEPIDDHTFTQLDHNQRKLMKHADAIDVYDWADD